MFSIFCFESANLHVTVFELAKNKLLSKDAGKFLSYQRFILPKMQLLFSIFKSTNWLLGKILVANSRKNLTPGTLMTLESEMALQVIQCLEFLLLREMDSTVC